MKNIFQVRKDFQTNVFFFQNDKFLSYLPGTELTNEQFPPSAPPPPDTLPIYLPTIETLPIYLPNYN